MKFFVHYVKFKRPVNLNRSACTRVSVFNFYLQHARKESYEGNQSFPKLPKTHRAEEIDESPPEKNKLTLDDFKGKMIS